MNWQKFDEQNKGRYVAISANGSIARRQFGFSDGLVLSNKYIRPGEVVAVEILETQPGWSGDLRIGFTLLSDGALFPLPSLAVPELVSRGQSWLVPVGTAAAFLVSRRHRAYWRYKQKLRRHMLPKVGFPTLNETSPGMSSEISASANHTLASSPTQSSPYQPFQRVNPKHSAPCFCCLCTEFGRIPLDRLMPMRLTGFRLPDVEKGSVVAVYYELDPLLETETALETEWHLFQSISNTAGFQRANDANRSLNDRELPGATVFQENGTYQFRFHIVINGIDFITVSEKLVLGSNQVGSANNSSLDPDVPMAGCCPRFRAVFDVYGQTKAVRLLNLEQKRLTCLSHMSTCVLLNHLSRLHIPGDFPNDSQQLTSYPITQSPSFKLSPIDMYPACANHTGTAAAKTPTDSTVTTTTTRPTHSVTFQQQQQRHMDQCASPFCGLCRAIYRLPLPQSELNRLHSINCAMVARELINLVADE